jgi:hypothetical protein
VVRAKAWHVAGALTNYSISHRAGKPLHEKGLMLAEEAGDHDVLSLTLNGATSSNHEDEENWVWRKELSERALRHTEGEVSYGRAGALLFHTWHFIREKRDYQRGFEMAGEARRILHTLGDHNWELGALQCQAEFADLLGRPEVTVQCQRDALQIAKQLGSDCIELACVCSVLYGVGNSAGKHRQATTMARLCSAADGVMWLIGQIMPDTDLLDVKKSYIEVTGETPDDAVFAEAWAEGRAMTLEQAIDYALEVADELIALEARRDAEK